MEKEEIMAMSDMRYMWSAMDSGWCTPRWIQPVRLVVFRLRVRVRKSMAADADADAGAGWDGAWSFCWDIFV